MQFTVSANTIKNNLENQLMHGAKKLIEDKHYLTIPLNELLAASKVSKKRFYQHYKNQVDLLHSANHTFITELEAIIPSIESKEDLTRLTDNLIEMTSSVEQQKRIKLLFQMNHGIDLNHFMPLKAQIFTILNAKMELFFQKIRRKTDSLNIDELKEAFYTIMEDSIIHDKIRNFHLMVYSLKILDVVFE
ncbi:hypothetical protein [Candidatus Enterococcus murrayae]|uniref:TetR/AcrR family transcriptional regulator n=1 Tax=Candidatus Enterococcus murrayae TaxID=2815321 RepID=A0ABS3HG15_9ENTE|nr:hypothetical protein [Enterococcus sp. MJM16]MBO0451860.1 hypothetical protein [Enterococcus sp. MJM16]